MSNIRSVTASVILLAFGAGGAQADLREETSIRNGIIFVGMAYEISQQCDEIGARMIRGIGYLQELKREARALGYSDAQIDAFVTTRKKRKRLERLGRAQLAALGVVRDDPQTYCAVGRDQMARETRVGWLLR